MLVIRLIESSALLIPSKSRSLDLVLYPIALRKHPGSSGLSDQQEQEKLHLVLVEIQRKTSYCITITQYSAMVMLPQLICKYLVLI